MDIYFYYWIKSTRIWHTIFSIFVTSIELYCTLFHRIQHIFCSHWMERLFNNISTSMGRLLVSMLFSEAVILKKATFHMSLRASVRTLLHIVQIGKAFLRLGRSGLIFQSFWPTEQDDVWAAHHRIDYVVEPHSSTSRSPHEAARLLSLAAFSCPTLLWSETRVSQRTPFSLAGTCWLRNGSFRETPLAWL